MTMCHADGCVSRVVARGLCRRHYMRAWHCGELVSGWTRADSATRQVQHLVRRGWSVRALSRTTGVSATALHAIERGEREHVQQWVADALTDTAEQTNYPAC